MTSERLGRKEEWTDECLPAMDVRPSTPPSKDTTFKQYQRNILQIVILVFLLWKPNPGVSLDLTNSIKTTPQG